MLFGLRRYRHGCLLLLGWAGDTQGMTLTEQIAARLWRAAGGFALGRAGWRRWRADRFRHPYLRDELLSAGWGVDTLETAAPWSALEAVYAGVREALQRAAATLGMRVVVGCHLSHAYRDGASLYFTFFWPLARGREIAQWGALKSAATEALLAAGRHALPPPRGGDDPRPVPRAGGGPHRGRGAGGAGARARPGRGAQPRRLAFPDPGPRAPSPEPRAPNPGPRAPNPEPRTPNPGRGEG